MFRESGIGSCWVGSGILGIAAASGRDGVASDCDVEADGAPVSSAPRVVVGGEGGPGRDDPRTGSGRCSDGPAS